MQKLSNGLYDFRKEEKKDPLKEDLQPLASSKVLFNL